MDQSYLKSRFTYDPEIGSLRWKPKGVLQWDARFAFKEFGHIDRYSGYRIGTLDGRKYRAHRLIWCIMEGTWPDEIDHKNHDRADNRWDNLREATRSQNMLNMSGENRGVTWSSTRKKWHARLGTKHLGYFSNKEDAIAARLKGVQKSWH